MAVAGEPTVVAAVREILSVVPSGCTWLLPVRAGDGRVVDFEVAAASDGEDLYGRGPDRVEARLSTLYPGMVDGPLWRLYQRVLATGRPERLPDYRHLERQSGIVSDARFDVSVSPVLGGLLVWWHRVDEDRRRIEQTELLGRLGWAEYDLSTGASRWSAGLYRVFDRDPALGPLSQAEQAAALLPEDRGLSEMAWQTLDSGGDSDVTVRFRLGASVKHLRILSQSARDADGKPVKIYSLIQDVTAREDSRGEIERLRVQLQRREMTALAEHRLAGHLQNMIQPVPQEPFGLPGLEAMVGYLPAESAIRVGGDWYHAQALPGGRVALAIGDVAGHGLDAAAGMAHLRYGLVAWLSIGIADPGALVRHLNRLCGQLRISGSAAVAVYEPTSRTMRWARGGHPAPLLARAGRVTALDQPRGLLLGAEDEAEYQVVAARLRAGDVVLFYTDGLVERRPSGGPAGAEERMARVDRVLATVSAHPDPQALMRLHTELNEASPDDDTCTLAVRVLP